MLVFNVTPNYFPSLFNIEYFLLFHSCMYVYIYSSDMDIYKNYTVIMKIIIYSVEISSPIGTISKAAATRYAVIELISP